MILHGFAGCVKSNQHDAIEVIPATLSIYCQFFTAIFMGNHSNIIVAYFHLVGRANLLNRRKQPRVSPAGCAENNE